MTQTIAPLKVESVPLDSLKQDPANVRKHSARNLESITASLQRFGQQKPIVVDAQGTIRAGNGTYAAAKAIGWKEIAVVRTNLNGPEAIAYAIADNRTAELAEWDVEALGTQWLSLDEDLQEAAGFEQADIDALLKEIGPVAPIIEDEAPDATTVPQRCAAGDLWQLGNHRLLCGDSTKASDVARLMGGAKASLCFTSPPYGAGNTAKLRDHYVPGQKDRKSFYDKHTDRPDEWFGLMRGWFAAVRPSVDCVVCNVQMLADNKVAMLAWLHENAADFVDCVVWDKTHGAPQMQRNVLTNAFEFMFIFGGNASRAIPFADWHGTVSNVVRIDPKGTNEHSDIHRATMPVAVPAWVFETLCPKTESVIDPFCGSGTTLIAAEQLGRRCFGLEISPKYCDVIIARWEKLTGRTAEKVA
jgi:DNA modification methylase